MGYKVYYDEMWEIIDKIRATNGKWNEQIANVTEKCEALTDSSVFKGAGANSINTYLKEVHGTLLGQIAVLLYELESRVHTYRYGYQSSVDGGDGSATGVRHTTIVEDEIEDGGEVCRKVNDMISLNDSLRNDVNSVRRSIQDLISLAYPTSADRLEEGLYEAKKVATDLNLKVLNYENEQRSCFDAVDSLISELKSIVDTQLSDHRVPVASYKSGAITQMCNYESLVLASEKVIKDINDLEDTYSQALELTFDRGELLEAERAEREKTGKILKWVVVGVCLVASVAVTVATAGAATPLVLGIAGAATGAVSAGANNVIDQYVEKGDLRGNFEWSDFGKDVLIGGAVGFATGYVGGAISAGSTAGQTFGQKVINNFATEVVGEVTEHTLSATWDVTEGVITGKITDIQGVITEIESEQRELLGDVVKDGIGCIVGTALDGAIEFGDDKLFDKAKDGVGKTIGKVAYTTVTDVTKGVSEDILTSFTDEVVDSVVDTQRGFEWANVQESFEEAVSGQNIVEKTLNSWAEQGQEEIEDKLIENYKWDDQDHKFVKEYDEDRKFKAEMKRKADENDKVTMIQFEDGTIVTKEDYETAKANIKTYTELDKEVGYKRNKNIREVLGVKTTQGATEIKVDYDQLKKADYKGKAKVDKYEIKPKTETKK